MLFTPANRALTRQDLKTETRRGDSILSRPPHMPGHATLTPDNDWVIWANKPKSEEETALFYPKGSNEGFRSRYGCPQREPVKFWMKEPVQVLDIEEPEGPGVHWGAKVLYLDTNEAAWTILTKSDIDKLGNRQDWRRPTTAMFMLKSFARTWLRGIRVWPEQLGEMSEESALAEGIKAITKDGGQTIKYGLPDADGLPGEVMAWQDWQLNPILAYRYVWESINGPDSWDPEKWVWAIKYELMGGAE